MQIGAMALPNLVGHSTPTVLVDFGEVGLVLGVDNPDATTSGYGDVGNKMAERPMARIGPVKRCHRFAQSTRAHNPASTPHLLSNMRLDVVLPKSIQRHRPREAVHLAPAAKTALVPDPTDGIEAAAKRLFEKRIASSHPAKEFRSGVYARHVIHAIEQTLSIAFEIDGNSILAANEHKLLQNPLERPPNRAAQKRIAR